MFSDDSLGYSSGDNDYDDCKYSDQVSSDIENELYSSVHFLDTSANQSTSLLENIPKNDITDVSVAKITVINESSNLNGLTLENIKSSRTTLMPCNSLQSSENNTSSESLIYESSSVNDNFNLKNFDSNKSDYTTQKRNRFFNLSSANKQKKKTKRNCNKLLPVTIDDDSFSEDSSDNKLSISLPANLHEMNKSQNSFSENWYLDIEDKASLKGNFRRFFNGKKCSFCRSVDHMEKSCPQKMNKKCYICGGDHISRYCCNKVCSFCYNTGHQYQKCPQRNRNCQIYCELCNAQGHSFNLCPDIWRRFHATTSSSENIIQGSNNTNSFSRVFCYNCGACGHLGHDCAKPKLRSDSLSSPFVLSYEHPKKMFAKSCEFRNRRKSRYKTMVSNNNTNFHQREHSSNFSTPLNPNGSGSYNFHSQRRPSRFKKRKLQFQEEDFQRTKSLEQQTKLKKKKKKKSKKKKMNNTNQFSYGKNTTAK